MELYKRGNCGDTFAILTQNTKNTSILLHTRRLGRSAPLLLAPVEAGGPSGGLWLPLQ